MAGSPGLAGQVNQLLGDHSSVIIRGETLISSQETGTAVYTGTSTTHVSQRITTGPTQVGVSSVSLQISTVGGSVITDTISDLTVSLYASLSGSPTGSAIASVSVAETYVYGAPFWVSVPLTVNGLTSSTDYHVAVAMTATGPNHYYAWQRSNQTSGAFTSVDGTSWIPQTYGMMFRQYTSGGGASLSVKLINEDNGARTTQLSYDGSDQLTALTQLTISQGGSGSFSATPTLTYTNGLITGIS